MSLTTQLLLFADVVHQGSFSKAAALHNMDNSSLSKKIKKLELELGVQLLNRSTRSFSLTSAGENILEQTIKLNDILDDIQLIAKSYQSQPKGILRITSPIYFGQNYLQPVISCFINKYPDIQIIHSLDDRKADIISEQFDIAFRLGKLTESNLIAKKIADTHFILIASSAFVHRYGLPQSPQQLTQLPAIVYNNIDVTLDQLQIKDNIADTDFITYKMQAKYKVSDVKTMINAAKDGLGYALIDLSNLEDSLENLDLVQLLPEMTISRSNTAIYAVYPHRKQTMLVKEFIHAVQEHIGTPPRWEAYLPQ
ncbi:LysR family transcriptional regulator [Photobacterium iliopiscarium]|jgi:DNA-binding transcriptional LysR family regulator|uniref:LysR family transcriptional regulator n=1 Tax=Photobacterium iliopiscarium TaxID=56192 RepID=A0A2T3MJS2_9GAMM|nr:LysR family transcriptional regulator [Photobacterium iliopiscarium]PST95617.1 LysR family transcriptional regulator [Photobacterium iliopiscarium]PSU00911.1 LysR family transcriptional regulator [Photobacterium iliopiscarium]PSV82118.1 LysR family transcriptional regulator [Photobacterium iliopiscarium]PSV96031.1 LysR family transcriptional regulator [Photobacterium iliopiscarium]